MANDMSKWPGISTDRGGLRIRSWQRSRGRILSTVDLYFGSSLRKHMKHTRERESQLRVPGPR